MKHRCPTSCVHALIMELLENRHCLLFVAFVPPCNGPNHYMFQKNIYCSGCSRWRKYEPEISPILPECLNCWGIPWEEAVLAGPRDRQFNVKATELIRKNKPMDFGWLWGQMANEKECWDLICWIYTRSFLSLVPFRV